MEQYYALWFAPKSRKQHKLSVASAFFFLLRTYLTFPGKLLPLYVNQLQLLDVQWTNEADHFQDIQQRAMTQPNDFDSVLVVRFD